MNFQNMRKLFVGSLIALGADIALVITAIVLSPSTVDPDKSASFFMQMAYANDPPTNVWTHLGTVFVAAGVVLLAVAIVSGVKSYRKLQAGEVGKPMFQRQSSAPQAASEGVDMMTRINARAAAREQ